jgi:phospholipid/cholesterol/gamma-HCH transport system substrate-binding protein
MKPSPEGANAPPPRGHEREILVGLFVIVGIVAVLTVLFTLTSPALFRGRLVVSTVVVDAGGIRSGDPVQMKGVNIGRVSRFRLRPTGVAIELELEKELSVPRDSEVLITSRGLLGDKVAQVIPGRSSELLRNGDVLPGVAEEGAGVTASRIADETTRELERVQALLSERTVSNVESSSVELSKLLGSLSSAVAEERGELERTTRALRRAAESVEHVAGSPEIARTLEHLDAVTKSLDELTPELSGAVSSLGRASRSMESVLGRMERGEGTLGRLSKDDALYLKASRALDEASRAAEELARLGEDVRRHPERYVKLSLF